jgi:hypothetical protein
LSIVGLISRVALLRAQRRHDEALDLALETVRHDPLGARPRIAVALCLIDVGRWHEARSILDELRESDGEDPRVKGLAALMGQQPDMNEFEVAIALQPAAEGKNYLDEAPINPMAGALVKGGLDEALTANALIVAHEGVRRGVAPNLRRGWATRLVHFGLIFPLYAMAAMYVSTIRPTIVGVGVGAACAALHLAVLRMQQQQRHLVKQRDQRAMIEFGRRLRRRRAVPSIDNTPIGTHLLLTGLLLTVNGIVLDIGLPAWLVERSEQAPERRTQARLQRRAARMERANAPRTKPLGKGWWLKREDTAGPEPALERLIGPSAYRGRTAAVQVKGRLGGSMATGVTKKISVADLDLGGRGIPSNTRRSERF